MFIVRLIIRLWAWLKGQHIKHTSQAAWFCCNNLCRCYNTNQKKRYYFVPPKCPKCGKLMKNRRVK